MSEYITREGMLVLQKKILSLQEERPIVIEQMQTAREQGDLKENAEYQASKERLRNLDNDLNNLNNKIPTLKVIDHETLSKDAVRFGAYVLLEEKKTGDQLKYRLVGVDEIYEMLTGKYV